MAVLLIQLQIELTGLWIMILAEKKNHMWYDIFAISPTHSEKEEQSESSYWQVSLVCVYGEQCCAGFDVSSSPVKGQKHAGGRRRQWGCKLTLEPLVRLNSNWLQGRWETQLAIKTNWCLHLTSVLTNVQNAFKCFLWTLDNTSSCFIYIVTLFVGWRLGQNMRLISYHIKKSH